MATVWINPNKANLPEKEQKQWIALMTKHHPEHDWAALMEKLKAENPNVKRTGRKSKTD
jgi:hypothetical protein